MLVFGLRDSFDGTFTAVGAVTFASINVLYLPPEGSEGSQKFHSSWCRSWL